MDFPSYRNQSIFPENYFTGFYIMGALVANPFHATGLFLYPLKTSETLWFSNVFRGYRKRPMA